MKVVHLNASDKGGASIVAQRLNAALNQYTTVSSQHLIFDSSRSDLPETQVWANTPLRKLRALVNHALDKFDFLQYERDPSMRFQFNHARIGVDISEHPLILDADIIHIHWILKGFLSFDSLKKLLSLGKPVVWTCHDLWPFTGGCFYLRNCEELKKGCGNCFYLSNSENMDSSRLWLYQKSQLFTIPNLFWVSPSSWVIDQVRDSILFKQNGPIKKIPNPVNVLTLKVLNQNEKVIERENRGLDPNKFTLLFSAAFIDNPVKGFVDFCNIIRMLPSDTIQAVVIGKSKHKIDLPIPFLNTGYLSDLNEIQTLFSLVDVYITSSTEETFGMTVAESLASGVPVICYDVGALPELIDNGVNGFVYPKGEWKQMAEGVVKLIDNPELLAEFSVNARIKAETLYDEAKVSQQYAELYHSIRIK